MNPSEKKQRLFLMLGCFFIANAIIAEFIGVKIFSAEKTFGLDPANLKILGYTLDFNLTAGVLLWPLVFVMTDIINEYFGKKGVKLFSYIAAVLISYAYLTVLLSMKTVPADFWAVKRLEAGELDMNSAYNEIFGQGLWIIAGSLTAFLVGQLVDVRIFHFLKRKTGESKIWLRATGSTLISQFFDSFIVLLIAFYFSKLGTPDQWALSLVVAIGLVNYIYKVLMAVLLTPLLYLAHYFIDRFLGKETSEQMRREAHRDF
jgi:uncharacterized integral membrane protein (TIGR00697 family)